MVFFGTGVDDFRDDFRLKRDKNRVLDKRTVDENFFQSVAALEGFAVALDYSLRNRYLARGRGNFYQNKASVVAAGKKAAVVVNKKGRIVVRKTDARKACTISKGVVFY